ncbi:MAG: ABC transporter substrate-binding protein [Rhodoglobus sp.]
MGKRTNVMAVTMTAVLLGITACSSGATGTSGEQAAGDGTVTVFHRWTEGHKAAVEAVFERCDAELPDIQIKISSVPSNDYEVQLPITLSSSTPPDIYALWPGGRPAFQVKNGLIAPITDFYNKEIAPTYSDGANAGATEVDGEVYVMPFNVQPNAFYYRKDIFDKLGLTAPETWDEFVSVMATLKKNDVTPIVLGSKNGWEPLFWFDYLIMRVAGPEFRARLMQGQESYLDPKVVAAMDMWGELIDSGYFNDNVTSLAWEDMTPYVADGRAAMMLMGPWAVDSLKDAGLAPTEQFGVFPFPEIDSAVETSTEGAMEGWATTGARDNTADVEAVLKCFASTGELTQYVEDFTTLTPNPEVSLDGFSADLKPFAEQWKEMSEKGSFQQNLELATSPPVTEVAKRELPRFLSNTDDAMKVLEALQQASEREFGN